MSTSGHIHASSQRRPPAAYERLLPSEFMAGDLTELRQRYLNARPFPHICIDGIFDPAVLDQIRDDWPSRADREWIVWDTKNERKETSRGIADLSPLTQTFLLQLCTTPFLEFLKRITGQEELLPDPLFFGAGLMECFRGGWLNIHGDYTKHPVLPLARRINLLIYVNRDWNPSWQGDLELWDSEANSCAASFAPLFNRTVIFNTTADALHGHPAPLACPDHRSRQVLSVYYWSTDTEHLKETNRINWTLSKTSSLKNVVRRFVPPILFDLRDLARRRTKAGSPR